ncbi:MAG: ATP-binding protein [Halobacteriota archaeon]
MDEQPDRPWADSELALLSRDELETLVRARSEALETVLDTMVDVLLKLDPTGRIELANAAVESTLGYDPESIVGKPIDVLLSSEGAAGDREVLTAGEFGTVLVRDGQVPDLEVAFSTAEGTVVPMSLSTSVIEDADGIGGFVCVAKDVSDRIERERHRQRKAEQLELLNVLVRHDIRNDVDLVLAQIRAIRKDSPPPDEPIVLGPRERHSLDRIAESGHRIAELTETARNLTRTIAELEEECKPIALAPVLKREIAAASTLSEDAVIDVDGDIPAVVVRANEMLGSVFRNLLANAIEHTDADVPRVRVAVSMAEASVTVRIADNGPGLPKAQRRALRSATPTPPESGPSGFGLYIVGTVIEQYGGHLDVEETGPGGTRIAVTLDRAEM